MKATPTILHCLDDPALFKPFMASSTWGAWRAFLASLFALPMSEAELATYRACTGRTSPPAAPFNEAWLCCGRRSGKSFVLALTAVFVSCFKDYRPYLQRGEKVSVLIMSADRKQSRTILRYISGLLEVPLLKRMVVRKVADGFDLSNQVSIEVATASYRTTRGYTVAAVLCDEIAYWSAESSTEPDTEVLQAVRPALVTLPNSMLLAASSSDARKGALYQAHERWHARDDARVLYWVAPTRTMNSTVPQSVIDEAMEEDPSAAGAEWLCSFALMLKA